MIKEVAEQSGGAIDLAPSRTQVVCSTPQLIERYRALGYEVLTAEAVETAPGQWNTIEALPINGSGSARPSASARATSAAASCSFASTT